MKKLLSLLSVLFLIYWGCEDSMDNEKSFIEFTNLFGGGGDDVGCSVQQTTDGGYIITGYLSYIDSGMHKFDFKSRPPKNGRKRKADYNFHRDTKYMIVMIGRTGRVISPFSSK